jgi:DICT domain-containing protein
MQLTNLIGNVSMNHASELNKLIEVAARRSDFNAQGYRSFEAEETNQLAKALKTANLFFTCSVLGMEAVSHVIEDQAVNLGGQFRFYSAFQKMSRFRPQEERYRRLFKLGNPIYLFGIPDVPVRDEPNLHFVPLNRDDAPNPNNLAHNWFVVLDNPGLVSMALVARELPSNPRPVGAPDKLVYRNFEGFWTYDKDIIGVVVGILDDYITRQQVVSAN